MRSLKNSAPICYGQFNAIHLVDEPPAPGASVWQFATADLGRFWQFVFIDHPLGWAILRSTTGRCETSGHSSFVEAMAAVGIEWGGALDAD